MVDQERYNANLASSLRELDTEINTLGALDNSVKKLNDLLDSCARSAAPNTENRPRKAKLRTWTPEVQKAIVAKRKRFSNGRKQ